MMAKKKPVSIDDVLIGKMGEFRQGEYDDPPQGAADRTRKPELDTYISCEFHRQTTAAECAATLTILLTKIPEIERHIMTHLSDEGIRVAITALNALLNLRSTR